MKKLKTFICFILMFVLFCSMNVVRADSQQIWDDWLHFSYQNRDPGIYVGYGCSHGAWEGNPASLMKLNDGSGRWVYCVEPFVTVSDRDQWYVGYTGDVTGAINSTTKYPFSIDQWNRVQLIAWYGYGYGNHTADDWYVATQLLIWKTVDTDLDIGVANTAADARAGRVNRNYYSNLENEIMGLVNAHGITPNFNITNPLVLNTPSTFYDLNNVFSNYNIISTTNCNATKNGNYITITPTKVGDISVTLCKGNPTSTGATLYAKSNFKNVVLRGEVPVKVTITAKAKIEDENKKMRIKITENSVKYKENGKLYELNTEKHEFTVDYELNEKNELVFKNKINVDNYRPTRQVLVRKTDDKTGEPLEGCKFSIVLLNENGEPYVNQKGETVYLVKDVVTNKDGEYLIEKAPKGRYKFIEVEAPEGYDLAEQEMEGYEFEINDESPELIIFEVTNTGDIAVIALVCVAVVSVLGIAYVILKNKKKKDM